MAYLRRYLKDLREENIQELYFRFPYLIEEQFENIVLEQFYSLPSGFADLVLFLNGEIVVVELKVDPLEKAHVLQLDGYMKDLQNKFPDKKIRGIIIGKVPKERINSLIITLSFPLKIKILEKDIPVKVKICEKCRFANNTKNKKCVKCESDLFLPF